MEDIEKLGENASEMINKLSRQLEHARDLNDLLTRFINIDDLHMNFYLPTSDNVNYINVNKYVFGNPERLFDASGSYTIPLNKSQVYLSEVPLTMLNIPGAPVDWNYMKNFRISDGDFQYNISGFDDEGIISNTNSYLYVLGNAVASSKTFETFNSIKLNLKEINGNSIGGKMCNLEAYGIYNNSFNSVIDLNVRCNTFSGNSLTLSSVGVLSISAKDINNVSIDVWNTDQFQDLGKSITLQGDLMLSNITGSCLASVLLKGEQISGVSLYRCAFVDIDVDNIYDITLSSCYSVYIRRYNTIINSGFNLSHIGILDLPSLNGRFSINYSDEKISGLNLRSMDNQFAGRWLARDLLTVSYMSCTMPCEYMSCNGVPYWVFDNFEHV